MEQRRLSWEDCSNENKKDYFFSSSEKRFTFFCCSVVERWNRWKQSQSSCRCWANKLDASATEWRGRECSFLIDWINSSLYRASRNEWMLTIRTRFTLEFLCSFKLIVFCRLKFKYYFFYLKRFTAKFRAWMCGLLSIKSSLWRIQFNFFWSV